MHSWVPDDVHNASTGSVIIEGDVVDLDQGLLRVSESCKKRKKPVHCDIDIRDRSSYLGFDVAVTVGGSKPSKNTGV